MKTLNLRHRERPRTWGQKWKERLPSTYPPTPLHPYTYLLRRYGPFQDLPNIIFPTSSRSNALNMHRKSSRRYLRHVAWSDKKPQTTNDGGKGYKHPSDCSRVTMSLIEDNPYWPKVGTRVDYPTFTCSSKGPFPNEVVRWSEKVSKQKFQG